MSASLNGTTEGGWLTHSGRIEQVGADGLELNIYALAADPMESGEQVEMRAPHVIRAVRDSLSNPIAVKLSPFCSSLADFTRQVDELGIALKELTAAEEARIGELVKKSVS